MMITCDPDILQKQLSSEGAVSTRRYPKNVEEEHDAFAGFLC